MISYINEKDKNKSKVIYLITCYVGKHNKQYHYIGLTKRPLIERFKEHCKGNTAVSKFIKTNPVNKISIEVLRECKYEQMLDSVETMELCKYFLHKGTPANQKNRLLNVDFKGLTNYTLKEIKNILKIIKM